MRGDSSFSNGVTCEKSEEGSKDKDRVSSFLSPPTDVSTHLSCRQAACVGAAPDPPTPEAAASSARPAPERVAPSAGPPPGDAAAPAPLPCSASRPDIASLPPTLDATVCSGRPAPERVAASAGGAAGGAVASGRAAAAVAGAAAAVAAAAVARLQHKQYVHHVPCWRRRRSPLDVAARGGDAGGGYTTGRVFRNRAKMR